MVDKGQVLLGKLLDVINAGEYDLADILGAANTIITTAAFNYGISREELIESVKISYALVEKYADDRDQPN
jgi:hypothetical protein